MTHHYSPTLHQKTTELFTPSLIFLDSWEFTHLSLHMAFMYSLSFSSPQLFYLLNLNKSFSGSEAESSPIPDPFLRLPTQTDVFRTKSGNPLPSPHIHFHILPPLLHIHKLFGERIKACMRANEWLDLDSNCIK